jgi:hypothetical protein
MASKLLCCFGESVDAVCVLLLSNRAELREPLSVAPVINVGAKSRLVVMSLSWRRQGLLAFLQVLGLSSCAFRSRSFWIACAAA